MSTIAHANGTQNGVYAQKSHAPHQAPEAWEDMLTAYAEKALDYYGPDLGTRIDKAIRIVLDGRVQPSGEHAHVSSETDETTVYAVTKKGCECQDARTKAPEGMCKHRLAWMFYRRTGGALQEVESEPELEPGPSDQMRIPAWMIIDIRGKQFVTYTGLLTLAQQAGLQSLDVRFIDVTTGMATAIATARFADGRLFTECGDATPDNVNRSIAPHFARMALTRAKARALRDALNIGMCSVEELAD